MIHKIKALYDEGNESSIRSIARELGISRNIVRKYLRDLRTLAGVLAARRPRLILERGTSAMLNEALTGLAVTTTPDDSPRCAASLHRFKTAVRLSFA